MGKHRRRAEPVTRRQVLRIVQAVRDELLEAIIYSPEVEIIEAAPLPDAFAPYGIRFTSAACICDSSTTGRCPVHHGTITMSLSPDGRLTEYRRSRRLGKVYIGETAERAEKRSPS